MLCVMQLIFPPYTIFVLQYIHADTSRNITQMQAANQQIKKEWKIKSIFKHQHNWFSVASPKIIVEKNSLKWRGTANKLLDEQATELRMCGRWQVPVVGRVFYPLLLETGGKDEPRTVPTLSAECDECVRACGSHPFPSSRLIPSPRSPQTPSLSNVCFRL